MLQTGIHPEDKFIAHSIVLSDGWQCWGPTVWDACVYMVVHVGLMKTRKMVKENSEVDHKGTEIV